MRPYRWPLLRPLFLAYWRLREREVDDVYAETTGSKSAPDYEYGKVGTLNGYKLLVISETGESPMVCCGYCSAGMVCVAARAGITATMSSAAHPIRSEGGRPHDNGSRASELRDGAKRAHGVTLDALAVSEIPGQLRAGYAVVCNLDYAEMPAFLRVQSGSFGHSIALYGWVEDGDRVGVFDPLWPQGASGAWCPWGSLKPALWGDGEHSAATVRRPEPEDPDEPDPPAPPPVDTTPYSQADLEAAAGAAASWAILLDDDGEVRTWLDWLRAPRAGAADRWDAGAWLDVDELLELELAGETPDPCDAGAPAVWSRGDVPAPAAEAIAALTIPASWDVSAWRAGAWR